MSPSNWDEWGSMVEKQQKVQVLLDSKELLIDTLQDLEDTGSLAAFVLVLGQFALLVGIVDFL